MTNHGAILGALCALALSAITTTAALAQEVTLKLHQFLPAQANVPKDILDVWADNIERDSGGRIAIARYPSMQLGGAPTELMDQAIDGVADVIWTAVGYTPGRFPSTEVFELPFLVSDASAASYAFWNLYESDMQEEFRDVRILATWVHGPGVIHASDPVLAPADMEGMKIRGASRQVNALLETLGATPVGMPVPAIPEALSKGVIDGTTIPWEVTESLKISELVEYHTEFTGPMLYTLTFVLAMNKEAYQALPDDLKQVVDDNSGLDFSVFAGRVQQDADAPARQIALDAGNEVVTLDAAQSAEWARMAQPVYDDWLADMQGRGIDGQALIDKARALMDEFSAAH
ncbi:TRAP transporter substrate-binding protein [Oceaniglobus trochenteri]|uniref:TRAP transporter substrate-binding protein n=1 Tax=Oceaniglobus trochenteri TaxID=2763260 RepID=UPI001D00103C|nr:TRAP transporter substrate-binding protein [Oceaniglobus trochenteri]